MLQSNQEKLWQLLEAVNLCRGLVLDSIEVEFGDSERWEAVRARILRAFGDRGLANRVTEIMSQGALSCGGAK